MSCELSQKTIDVQLFTKSFSGRIEFRLALLASFDRPIRMSLSFKNACASGEIHMTRALRDVDFYFLYE